MDLTLTTRVENEYTVVEAAGEIDAYTAPGLRDRLSELVAAGRYRLVVDLEKVEFLDSSGLCVLLGGLERVRAHDGSLCLVCTQDRIIRVFRVTGLTQVFSIHPCVQDAIAATDALV